MFKCYPVESPNLLDVNQLTMGYTAGTLALDAVSFAVRQGTVHAILGEDGAGKTTLMKILGGVITADKIDGQIVLAGQVLALAFHFRWRPSRHRHGAAQDRRVRPHERRRQRHGGSAGSKSID